MRRCHRSIAAPLILMLFPIHALGFSTSVGKGVGLRISVSRLQQQQQQQRAFIERERPCTFLDSHDDGDNDIKVMFSIDDYGEEGTLDDKNKNIPGAQKGDEFQRKRWSKLKSKPQLEDKRDRKNETRKINNPLKQKESSKDKKRRA
jgi:hypothetical protein